VISKTHKPDELSRAELDAYLARGWFRIGSVLITTEFLTWEGEVCSVVWTRLPLHDYAFKRSLQKLMASNARLFTTKVGPAVIDEAREALYARYCASVGGQRSPTLERFLGDPERRQLFDTREIGVFLGDTLVAFSWFDLGQTSVQSLLGVYDPDHAEHSLGFYTILLEIAHALELGLSYHYTGYVLADRAGMDYKRRVGNLEYLDPITLSWSLAFPYPRAESPAEILRRRLHDAATALDNAGAEVGLFVNAALQIPALLERQPRLAADPFLLMSTAGSAGRGLLVRWVPARDAYELIGGEPLALQLDGADEGTEPLRFFLRQALLCEARSVAELALLYRAHSAAEAS
jgi:arginine-tRNA-protein transferase